MPDSPPADGPPPVGLHPPRDATSAAAHGPTSAAPSGDANSLRPTRISTDRLPALAPPSDLPDVPGYEVAREIARGGMGRVLAARDRALGREVAIKVLLPGRASPDSDWRFRVEARVTARLPHPGVPPVYAIGTLPDGGPFLAMKLVRGRTLSALLRERPHPGHDLPRWVGVFAHVADAVGFAHSVGVIHRDLKPGNVMVGAFGEVQVMDWGLAKALADVTPHHGAPPPAAGRRPAADDTDDADDRTLAGSVIGTPAYMAPEQARGEGDRVGPAADVFALGGLTGRPPFADGSAAEALERAAGAALGDAFGRLDACGADPELIRLAKWCLAPDPADRPADGAAVAAAVDAYRAGVEERLWAAERDRAAADGRATEQRKRRRTQLALAAAVGLMAVAGGAAAWWQDKQAAVRRLEEQRERDRVARDTEAVDALLAQCEAALRAGDGNTASLCVEQARRRWADGGGDGPRDRLDRCQTDRDVLVELDRLDRLQWTAGPSRRYKNLTAAAGRELVFRRYGLEAGACTPATTAALIGPSLVRERLVAELDQLLRVKRYPAVRQVLTRLDPDAYRERVRGAVLAGDAATVARLASQAEALSQPAGFLVVLGVNAAIPLDRRHQLLETAALRHPGDVRVLMTVGRLLPDGHPRQQAERVRWFQAARAADPRNPATLLSLGNALQATGEAESAAACYREAIRTDPATAPAHYNLGIVLKGTGDADAALACFREAARLDPNEPDYQTSLGVALQAAGQLDAAIACFREAARLDPATPAAHAFLGQALKAKGDAAGAAAALREAARVDPASARAHAALGGAYLEKGDFDAAVREFREAVRLDPGYAKAHHNLGVALSERGDPAAAVDSLRTAVRLDPASAKAHLMLGMLLRRRGDVGEAIAHHRDAVRLDPTDHRAHYYLGLALEANGDHAAAAACFRETARLDPAYANGKSKVRAALARPPASARPPVEPAPPPRLVAP